MFCQHGVLLFPTAGFISEHITRWMFSEDGFWDFASLHYLFIFIKNYY